MPPPVSVKAMQCLVERSPCEAMACARSFEERVIGFKDWRIFSRINIESACFLKKCWRPAGFQYFQDFFRFLRVGLSRLSQWLSNTCMWRFEQVLMKLKDPSKHDVKSYGKFMELSLSWIFWLFSRHHCNPSQRTCSMNRTGLPTLRRNAW